MQMIYWNVILKEYASTGILYVMHLMAPYFDMNLNYSLSYGFVPEDKEYNARAIWAILFNT